MTAENRAAALKAAFDASFARPHEARARETEDLLFIRSGGAPYALRLRELSGLVAKRPIVPVPSRAPGLLGLVGIRGEIVPAFDLAALLGGRADLDRPWLALSPAPQPLALAFSQFDGFARVEQAAVHPASAADAARPWLTEFVGAAGGARAVIGVQQLVDTLRSRLGPSRAKEQ